MTSNIFRTIADVTFKSADVLSNSLGFTSKVNRNYDDRFAKTGAKIGNTTNMRLPGQFTFSDGAAIDIQALSDRVMPLTLTKQYQRSFSVNSADLALSVDDFTERYTKPAMISMANEIDYDGMQVAYQYAQNAVGTVGTAPASTAAFQAIVGAARRKLSENLAPMGETVYMIAPPTVNELGYTYLTSVFNPQNVIGEQYTSGVIARAGGFDWMESQLVPNYKSGTYGGTPVTNGAAAQGTTSLVTDGWTATTTSLAVGTVFTVAGVFAVNAQTKVSLGYLQQFTVTEATVTDGAGNSTISFYPAMTSTGPAQNVTALAADGAAITVFGASTSDKVSSLAFHKNAFVFGTADLAPLNNGAVSKVVSLPELGLSCRVAMQDDIRSDSLLMRIDLLGGWAPLYPQLAAKAVWA